MDLKGITPELMEKAKTCKTSEELFALAKAEGVELTEEQLDAVTGGAEYGEGTSMECEPHSCSTFTCSSYWCYSVTCSNLDCYSYPKF